MTKYEDTLRAEVATWVIEDESRRVEKLRRERMRHYKLLSDLLLDRLGTESMRILEVGGGPLPLSDLLDFAERVVVDPLSDDYRKIAPCPDHVTMFAEDMTFVAEFDLAIATNSLDHTRTPEKVLDRMVTALQPGGWLAVAGAENNALTHPHPAHIHNLTGRWVRRRVERDFEIVVDRSFEREGYRYGWVPWQGKRGQPAFALLLRKCSGY